MSLGSKFIPLLVVLGETHHYRWVRSVKKRFCAKPGRPMVEQICGRAEGVWTVMNVVHGVCVTREARDGKAEKFIPLVGRGVLPQDGACRVIAKRGRERLSQFPQLAGCSQAHYSARSRDWGNPALRR
jgi:hypothetical protein